MFPLGLVLLNLIVILVALRSEVQANSEGTPSCGTLGDASICSYECELDDKGSIHHMGSQERRKEMLSSWDAHGTAAPSVKLVQVDCRRRRV